jgi:hypothetical protein
MLAESVGDVATLQRALAATCRPAKTSWPRSRA